jgi:SAM-dependent methyltransferase
VIDPAAATFERVAAECDYGRPSWPPEAIASVGLPREAAVTDLGAGTGKLTRVLLGRFDHVIAIEPLAGMRALIPGEAETLPGTAEEIPLPGESLDGVFCGESFHWFDWSRALPEIARVLRPGGRLAMFWNRGKTTWPPEVAAILDRVDHSPGEKRYQAFAWRDSFAGSAFRTARARGLPARVGSPERRPDRPDRVMEQLHDPVTGRASSAPRGDRPMPGRRGYMWIEAGSTTSKSEPFTRPSVRRSSFDQRGSGAPLTYQLEPLSATIIP